MLLAIALLGELERLALKVLGPNCTSCVLGGMLSLTSSSILTLEAAQYGKPYSGRPPNLDLQGRALCPLCSNPDSNPHLMAGCKKNPVFKGLYIKRHDIAVLAVAQTIAASPQGYASIFVDAGKHANLPEFAFGKGTDFPAVIQQVAPLDLLSDTSC
jgi:hypothetical protein